MENNERTSSKRKSKSEALKKDNDNEAEPQKKADVCSGDVCQSNVDIYPGDGLPW